MNMKKWRNLSPSKKELFADKWIDYLYAHFDCWEIDEETNKFIVIKQLPKEARFAGKVLKDRLSKSNHCEIEYEDLDVYDDYELEQ